jgi:polyisoprenoid-binding protein YceI
VIHRIALATTLLLASLPVCAAPATYTLEPDYTQGVFRWKHLGFSTPAAQFSMAEGTLEFDPVDPARSAVHVTIPMDSLHTGVAELDEAFRSPRLFDTGRFPKATFNSTAVEKAAAPNQLRVTGDLNLHGVTRPIVLDVTVTKIGPNVRTNVPTVGFDATATLRRSDFGLGAFVPQVADDIEIHITCEAGEARAYAQMLEAEAAEEAAAKKAAERK